MPEWLAPLLLAVPGSMALGFGLGVEWAKRRARREERRQGEIAALLVGEDPKNLPAPEDRAVVHRPVIESSHSWSEGNNGDF